MIDAAPMNPASHVDEVTGLLYIEGQLEAAVAREVVAHIEQCSACRRLLDTLKRESLLLRDALTEADEPLPARLLASRPPEDVSWGWLIAFGLAAAGLYTLWNVYISPWLDTLQQSGFGSQFVFTWLVFNGASWKGWNDMLQLIILVSLGVLGGVLLFLFRRNLRRLSSRSSFLGALVLLGLLFPPGARAGEFVKRAGNYELPDGETVKNDLFVRAAWVRIGGTVDGDLYCFCSSLTVDGHVTGDVIAFSHSVRITGKVDGSLRTFTGNEMIEGDVGRNVLSFVGSFQTAPHSHVAGSATLFVGDMQVDGPIGRDVAAFLGGGHINAPVGGSVWIHQGQHENEWHYGSSGGTSEIQVGPQADIRGAFRYKGPKKPDISPQAHLASSPQIEIVENVPGYRRPGSYWFNIMIWGAGLIVGLILIALFPGFMQESAEQAARIGPPLGLGLVAFIVTPLAGILACITVVGLGVGIPLLFLWIFLVFFAQIFTGLWIGDAILEAGQGVWAVTGRLALGLLLIRVGALIPVLGFWVRLLACLIGMGAIVLFAYRHLQARGLPPAPAAVPAVPAG